MTKKTEKKAVKKTVKKSNEKDTLQKLATDLFSLMGVNSTPEVSEDKKNNALLINIQTDNEAGLLIGSRGKTLLAIQTLLTAMFRQTTGEWKRVLVNISDWREKEEGRLIQLAKQTAERAKESGEIQYLYNLTPYQRRIIHLALAEDKGLVTESHGEGEGRYLTVSAKK